MGIYLGLILLACFYLVYDWLSRATPVDAGNPDAGIHADGLAFFPICALLDFGLLAIVAIFSNVVIAFVCAEVVLVLGAKLYLIRYRSKFFGEIAKLMVPMLAVDLVAIRLTAAAPNLAFAFVIPALLFSMTMLGLQLRRKQRRCWETAIQQRSIASR